MTLSDIALHRLVNQQITGGAIFSVTEMLEWFGAIQGQEYAHAKWALGLRLPQLKEKDIEAELTKGTILRTHLLRPTWHLVSANDIRWLLQLTAPRVHALNAYHYRQAGLDQAIFNQSIDIMGKALSGGQQLTRTKLNEQLSAHGIPSEGGRSTALMMYAELEGIICSGARKGKQFTYALLDERAPGAISLDREEALARLSRQYFFSRGPATLADFATWSGLTLADCRKGLVLVENLLRKEIINDTPYYCARELPLENPSSRTVQLLPIYDEYIIGYKDRSAYLQSKNTAGQKASFTFDNIVVAGGQIVGTWKRAFKSKHIELTINIFESLSGVQKRALDQAIEQFGHFHDLPLQVT
ncbi:winged helix DNA-binding domain-containing protein [Taibaiella sp. KBW10]|uniref:winged helix DNA-binding domain-containing protein n=1 Tax=Taibaiella sp. KBW10 TaxID=2153357 RepID=UPI001F44D2BA|nr:winged helix DNA-binding domain-containing protein [Taibaiella sp. KBW10]